MYVTYKTNCILLVLHVKYISLIQYILFSINLKVTSFRISFAAGYIMSYNIIRALTNILTQCDYRSNGKCS